MVPNIMQIMQMYQQFRQNPMALLGRKYNIPAGVQNPQEIIQHLLNSGQITQEQVNNAMQMKQSFFR